MRDEKPQDRDAQLLAEYLMDHDVPCPACSFNLRDLASEACPECRAVIDLRIGERQIKLGWFTAAIAPGAFSGVLSLLLMLAGLMLDGNPFIAGPIIFIGLVSAAISAAIVASGDSFIRQSAAKQAGAVATLWAVHLALFCLLVFVAAVI